MASILPRHDILICIRKSRGLNQCAKTDTFHACRVQYRLASSSRTSWAHARCWMPISPRRSCLKATWKAAMTAQQQSGTQLPRRSQPQGS